MKNLQNFGVQELNAEEITNVEGGNPWFRLVRAILVAGAAAHDTFCSGDHSGTGNDSTYAYTRTGGL